MKKLKKVTLFTVFLLALVWSGVVLADRQILNEELIRLHVVAHSDSREDQAVKLQVRDAVLAKLNREMGNAGDVKKARAYLMEHLGELEQAANETLKSLGSGETAKVSLTSERFPMREYDTFSLPAGVYQSLRIVIGDGCGQNWWCVVFPSLCLPATAEGFGEAAVEAGFSPGLASALSGKDGYELRFFLLDCLGELENFFAGH